ncbi:MAG: hypothetical protein R2795_08850 [Saprospiraceae bacterium]
MFSNEVCSSDGEVGDWGCLIPDDFQIDIYQNGVLLSDTGGDLFLRHF